jgi:proline iminopeptidase
VGDRFLGTPDSSQSWQVAVFEPERFLALRVSLDLPGRQFDPAGPRPHHYTDSTWGFTELPGQRTWLVVSGYWPLRPRWLQPVPSVAERTATPVRRFGLVCLVPTSRCPRSGGARV